MVQIFKFFSWLCSLLRVYSIHQSVIIEVDLLLVLFRKRYHGFQFDSGLAMVAIGKAGADCEFNILLQSDALVGASLNMKDPLHLKILVSFSRIPSTSTISELESTVTNSMVFWRVENPPTGPRYLSTYAPMRRMSERTFSSLRIGLQVFQGKLAYGADNRFQHIVWGLTFCQTTKEIDPPA